MVMKKFLFIVLMAIALTLTFQIHEVKAYNYDVGVYPESGLRAYLMTETVSRYNGGFRCTVVCYPSRRPYYIDYEFWLSNGTFYFRNSDGYETRVSSYTPVESNVCRYVL